jgi:hypothetical protein
MLQNVVSLIKNAVEWLIPDIPRSLHNEMLKEAYLTNEIIIEQERKRAQALYPDRVSSGSFLREERNEISSDVRACQKRKNSDPEEIALSNFHIV